MPELPDVEVFKAHLDATSLHKRIVSVQVRSPKILKGISARKLGAALEGRFLESTRRHGKYLLVKLDNNKWLVLHFGMSGRLEYFKGMDEDPPYDRLLITFSNGYHLAYDSQRKLGEVKLIKDMERFIQAKKLGADVLDPSFDFQTFWKVLAGRRGIVKSTLMNQEIMAGIGNIYSDEILFQAGLHPKTKVSQLDKKTTRTLFRKLRDVLSTAIDRRANPQQLPASYLIPHRRKGARCPKCGAEIEQIKVSGFTSYFCPSCQPK